MRLPPITVFLLSLDDSTIEVKATNVTEYDPGDVETQSQNVDNASDQEGLLNCAAEDSRYRGRKITSIFFQIV